MARATGLTLPVSRGHGEPVSDVASPQPAQGPPVQSPQTAPAPDAGRIGGVVGAETKVGVGSRVMWFVLFALPLAVMITAASLSADSRGHSTHTQLGLPPCGFLELTKLPCPGCGLTTSFTNMIHGDFVEATRANPFGVLLFLVSFFTIPVAAVGFVKGLPVVDTLDRLHFEKWAILLAVTSILVWVIRIATMTLA